MCKNERMYVMRKFGDDIKIETEYHCCIHSHTKRYRDDLDKAVEKGNAGQGLDKGVINGPQGGQAGQTGLDMAFPRRRRKAQENRVP